MHTLKGEQINFKFLFILVYMFVSEVKLSQTFIPQQVQEIFTSNFLG